VIAIDGSFGEGGGAILRQAIGLAAYARRPIRITNTRARRPKPGLQPQHLEAVRAATAVVGARVTGATLGSTQLVFRPGDLRPGTYALDVGTAGATTLVLQSILLPCLCSRGEFTLDVRGGTDVPWSPPVDYLRVVMLPALRDIGRAKVTVLRRGYYPKGGGRIRIHLAGREPPTAIGAVNPGWHTAIRGVSHAANVLSGRMVAERQASAAEESLQELGLPVEITPRYHPADSAGSGVTLWTVTEGAPALGGAALGARGKPAEKVGAEAASRLAAEVGSGAVVDRYLADQLIPFVAVLGGALRTSAITEHCRSNIYVAERIFGARFAIDGLRITAQPLA
jgi:RNA 3'-terminal phosphate cyclase (GTP)